MTVTVQKLNPTVQVVHYGTMMLERAGTERTAFRFSIDGSGAVQRRQQPRQVTAGDPAQMAKRCPTDMELQKEIVGLSIAYALLAALLLILVLRARIAWPLKTAAVLVTSAFYCVAFFRIEGLTGWSAPAPLPSQFQLLWARIVEPNPLDRDPGAVHIWVEELDAANLPSGQPRAHRLPYSAALAQQGDRSARRDLERPSARRTRRPTTASGNGQTGARRSLRCLNAAPDGGTGRRSHERRSA